MNPTQLGSTILSRFPKATWICNNSAYVLGTARVKCKNKQRKRFQLLDPDTPIAANIVSASGKRFITQTSTSTRTHTFPKYKTGNQSHTLMVVPCKMRSANSKLWALTPTTDAGYSDTVTINPGGSGPTLTINRAKLAAVLIAVQKGHTEIATDIIPLTD